MDTLGSLIDKLATVNQKLFMIQEELYAIRHMTLEEFKEVYGSPEGLEKIYLVFKKSTDSNFQRQAMILEVDKKFVELVAAKNEELANFVQDQHKTY